MKTILAILLIVLLCNCSKPIAAKAIDGTIKDSSFALYYSYAGLGSNFGHKFKCLKINGTHLILLKQQNTYYSQPSLKTDTQLIRQLPYAFRDSINNCLNGLRDTNIYVVNHCVMSGGIDYFSIFNGTDTLKINMHNTAHPLAIKIANIVNHYLPSDQQIGLNIELMKSEADCLKSILKH